jgi:hypothetical protein
LDCYFHSGIFFYVRTIPIFFFFFALFDWFLGERATIVKEDDESKLDYFEEWRWSCCGRSGSSRDSRMEIPASFYNDAPGCRLKRSHFPSHQFV